MKSSVAAQKGSARLFSTGPHTFTKAGQQLFGDALRLAISDPQWSNIDIAVAWVRVSGLKHVFDKLKAALNCGRVIRLLVGIDKANTSYEALEALLMLKKEGNIRTWVYHDENDALIFHPKMYLFRNDSESRLLLGSSNLTSGGLYTNVEANMDALFKRADPLTIDIESQITDWVNEHSKQIESLTSALLKKLLKGNYIKGEKSIQNERIQPATGKQLAVSKSLFGRRVVQAPKRPAISGLKMLPGPPKIKSLPPSVTSSSASPVKPAAKYSTKNKGALTSATSRLIIRVRRASLEDRPAQIQIPFALEEFIGTTPGFTSLAAKNKSQILHNLVLARTGGSTSPKKNTWKIDIPEVSSMSDPILVLTKLNGKITYKAFDAVNKNGKKLKDKLLAGLTTGKTYITTPATPDKATMCQFV